MKEPAPQPARFFRDAAALGALSRAVRARRAAEKGTFRAWVASSSTGDDAFSAAFVLLEALSAPGAGRPLKLFATGPDAGVIKNARWGHYDADSVRALSASRRARFFSRAPAGFRVGPAARAACVFAVHDLCENLPFTHLDAVYCPLPLARWSAPAQRRALDLFHFALKPDGLLLLGEHAPLPDPARFKALRGRARLYSRVRVDASASRETMRRLMGKAAEALRSQWHGVEARSADAADQIGQDDFVAMVSHELRTPLAAILGFTETLKDGVADARQARAFLNTIEKNARRLVSTVDSLMGVVDSRSRQRQPAPIALGPSARAAAGMFRKAAAAGRVTIRVDVPNDLLVRVDPADLPHILENLIGNAVKYNRPGGSVLVEAARHDGQVSVSVSDTGVGIQADSLGRVFDRFYRCGDTRAVRGSGLGLAIVRGLAEGNGGAARVESVVGVGSKFIVTLPAFSLSSTADEP